MISKRRIPRDVRELADECEDQNILEIYSDAVVKERKERRKDKLKNFITLRWFVQQICKNENVRPIEAGEILRRRLEIAGVKDPLTLVCYANYRSGLGLSQSLIAKKLKISRDRVAYLLRDIRKIDETLLNKGQTYRHRKSFYGEDGEHLDSVDYRAIQKF